MPQLKPTRGLLLNKTHPLSRGLVGCWLMNEGSGNKVFDLSGNGNTGTLQADTHFVSGKFGPALGFDGTGDYVTMGNVLNFNATDPFSVGFWAKRGSTGYQIAVSKSESSVNYRGWQVYFEPDNEFGLLLRQDQTNRLVDYTVAAYTDITRWHHYFVTYDGSTNLSGIKFYVDGIVAPSVGVEDTLGAGEDTTNSIDLNIGSRDNGNTPFNGQIDHVTIYNRALSASKIAKLSREPFCMFERAWRPKLTGGQIVELAGTSTALSSLSTTAKATRKVGGTTASSSDITAVLNSIRGLAASTGGIAAVDGSLGITGEKPPEMERSWLAEALFNGMTANAFKLGTTLSLGWFWVRVAGCSVLYRGSSMGEINFANVLTTSEQDAGEISPPNYISHSSDSTYFYVVRRFNSCGCQERTLAAAVKVSIESSGDLAESRPNNISRSKVKQVHSNKIRLVWFYCPLEQKSQPVNFNVYYDDRTGQIDYQNPLATIGYKGRKFYSFQSDELDSGIYLFAIRAEGHEGIENSSLAQLKIQLNTTSLDEINILSAEAV